MDPLSAELESAAEAWEARQWPRPDVFVVTGSALPVQLGPSLREALDLAEIVPFDVHAVEGHDLRVELYEPVAGRVVAYFRGRLHCYQGFDPHQVVFPVRLAGLLGASTAVLTNAAGSVDPQLRPGKLVALADHINLSGLNPLLGELPPSWGPRFPSLNDAYDARLRGLARSCAKSRDLDLGEGTYAWLLGPSYETPAEIEMVRRAGAQLVGMSTVPEVIAARHLGMRCFALSLVTNLAAGLGDVAPDHQEVVEQGARAKDRIAGLLSDLLQSPDLIQAEART